MKNSIVGIFAITFLIALAASWGIISASSAQAAQQTAASGAVPGLLRHDCESPFHPRIEDEKETIRFQDDPIVRNFLVAKQTSPAALADAVRAHDQSIVPYLEYLAATRHDQQALLALIKLGDRERFELLSNRARCVQGQWSGENHRSQSEAVLLLVRLQTREAYRELEKMLDDTSIPATIDDMAFGSLAALVTGTLSLEVENKPAELDAVIFDNKLSSDMRLVRQRAIWKKWLQAQQQNP